MPRAGRLVLASVLVAFAAPELGCQGLALPPPSAGHGRPADGEIAAAITAPGAFCSAMVTGTGVVDVETDYLPHVVACENGGASFEALKVQAIAARSFLYYKLELQGYINDGTGDQVYSCAATPGPDHYAAVAATSGQVLMYSGVVIASFYVAGALQSPPSCMGGSTDPTGTEGWVTYNEGNSGSSVEQTPLGWVDPGNLYNRGCMSQNGSDCLSDDGWLYDDILRFYYGDDIAIVTATGPCVSGEAPACTLSGTVLCGGGETTSNDAAGSTDVVSTYGCVGWSYPGPEYAYAFSAPATEPVTVTVSGLSSDLDLFVLSGGTCDPFACVVASDNPMSSDETVTFDAVAGTDYAIVVDGYDGNISGFTIAFSCTAPEPPPPAEGPLPWTGEGTPGATPATALPPEGGPGDGDGIGDPDGSGGCACRVAGVRGSDADSAGTGAAGGGGTGAATLLLALGLALGRARRRGGLELRRRR